MTKISMTPAVRIPLHFRLADGWRWAWFTLIGVLLYQFFTLQRPGFGELGLYINYLLPFLVFGYVIFNVNLFLDYHGRQKARFEKLQHAESPENTFTKTIEARDDEGEMLLSAQEVWCFEVEGKSYRVYNQGKTHQIRKTLGELEAELDPETFFQVNRGVIVNLNFVKNYSFWENDKYMLQLQDDETEFVMQRTRLKELRARLGA